MKSNNQLILFIVGALLLVESIFMLFPGFVALYFGEQDSFFYFFSAIVTAIVGGVLTFSFREHSRQLSKRDSYIIVLSVWLTFAVFGTLPFIFGGHLTSIVDAIFESMSGITTTGATLMGELESASKGILLWRALLQWLGGMGIITFSLILLPTMGIGGMQMFSAEASVTRNDKMHPKVTAMAKYIWAIYIILTLLEVFMLRLGDMPWFDAVCHSLSTLSTGGFSTHTASLEFYNSAYIEYVVLFFMFVGGINFTLIYVAIVGKFKRFAADEELKFYAIVVVVATVIVSIALINSDLDYGVETSIRHAAFQVVAVITSSGFTTADYVTWPPVFTAIMSLLMLTGTCTGSTSGGIKLMRLTIMLRNIAIEVKRALHPTAVVPVKYNGKSLSTNDLSSVLGFVLFYIVILVVGVILISMFGYNLEDSYGLAANSLGNIGISIGQFGPTGDIPSILSPVKIIMAALMLIGRLEIFTVIIVFTRQFWTR